MTTSQDAFIHSQSSTFTRFFRSWISNNALFLLAITAIGGIFRFICLGRPSLWNDEALAYIRTCGTYGQMLAILRDDAFGPLHYELLWTLARRFQMTPFMMRLWPAIAGTFMVPAIYLLALELLGRRIARASAVFAACSAFLLAYSRDAKMYMPVWLFVTLNAGCVLWWMRTGRVTAWLGFVAAGCAAAGLHVTGLVVVALDVLIVFTGPNFTWRRSVALLAGLLLIGAGPIGYASAFNQVQKNIDQRGWRATGINWVSDRTAGHSGAALTADSAGGILFAYMWIDETKVRVQSPPRIMEAAAGFLALLSVVAVCGLVRWRVTVERCDLKRWRATMWLGIWIWLPVYGFYRATVPDAATWMDWGRGLWAMVGDHHFYPWIIGAFIVSVALASFRHTRAVLAILAAGLIAWCVGVLVARSVLTDFYSSVEAPDWLWVHPVVPVVAVIAALVVGWTSVLPRSRRVRSAFGVILFIAVILGLCQISDAALGDREVHPVWVLRYLGFISPAVIIAMAGFLMRLPVSALRWGIFGLLLAVNLAQAAAHVFASSEPPVDKTAADVVEAMNSGGRVLAFTAKGSPTIGPNAAGSITDFCGSYYLFMLTKTPGNPTEIRRARASNAFFPLRLDVDAGSIQEGLVAEPRARRIIVWDGLDAGERNPPEDVLPVLGNPWRLESQELYPVRVFWNWGELYTYRRRVFVR